MLLYVHFSGGNDMKRRKRLYRKNKQKKLIIIFLCTVLCFMVVGYSAFSTRINLTAKGNIKDKSRVIQRWNVYSDEDFHTDFYKENIVSVTFLDNVIVPSNAVEKWDVSESKDHGVMAYVTESASETGKYDLYIGAKNGVIANKNSALLFADFINLKNINFGNNFDTSNVINMAQMFLNCQNLTDIDLSSFNTENLLDMSGMFQMFDTKSQEDRSGKLKTIKFGSNFNTSNVTSMSSLFYRCSSLKTVDISMFNTSKVTNMSGMFYGCTSLVSIDLNNLNTSNVTNMYAMFWYASSLTKLDLTSFDISKVASTKKMFADTRSLTQICVSDKWNLQNVSNTADMFLGSTISEVTTGQCNN